MAYPNVTEALVLEFEGCAWEDQYKPMFPNMNFTWPEMLAHPDIEDTHKIWLFSLGRVELLPQQQIVAISYIDSLLAPISEPAELTALYAYLRPLVVAGDFAGINDETVENLFNAADQAINHPECADYSNVSEAWFKILTLRNKEKFMMAMYGGLDPATEYAEILSLINNLDWT